MPRSSSLEKVLLCSSPRSGSTFAANLIRSSPDVAFLNEIMTRGQFLLPNFCEAQSNSADGESMRAFFETEVESLLSYTLPHGGNLLHRSRMMKFLVFGMLKTGSSLTARAGLKGFGRNPFYRFYYLNGLHEPFFRPFLECQFPKNRSCRVLMIKEVHLLSSYTAFRSMYPDGKIIFLVRDPYKQVASERKHRGFSGKGYLGPRDPGQSDRVGDQMEKGIAGMQDRYGESELIRNHYGQSFEETFSLFWRLDNDAVVAMTEREPANRFLPLRYEDLVADTRSVVEEIIAFLGLEFSENLERYLRVLSNFRGSQKHGRSTFVTQGSMERRPESGYDEERVARISEVITGSTAANRFGYG